MYEKKNHLSQPAPMYDEFSVRLSDVVYGNISPFPANVPILCPMKTRENQRFSGVFRGYKMGTLARNGLIKNATFFFKTLIFDEYFGKYRFNMLSCDHIEHCFYFLEYVLPTPPLG